MPKTYAMSPSKSNAQTSDFNVWMMEAINVLSECSFWRNDITNRNTCGIHGFMTGLCVCVCVRPCMYICVRVQIYSLCVWNQLYIHMKIPRIRHICRRHPLKNLHTMDIGSVYIHLLPKDLLGSTRSPGRVLQSIDQIPSFFSDMRLAKDCYT